MRARERELKKAWKQGEDSTKSVNNMLKLRKVEAAMEKLDTESVTYRLLRVKRFYYHFLYTWYIC